MSVDDVKTRLHGALHRHPKATEDEVEAIAAVVLAIVADVGLSGLQRLVTPWSRGRSTA